MDEDFSNAGKLQDPLIPPPQNPVLFTDDQNITKLNPNDNDEVSSLKNNNEKNDSKEENNEESKNIVANLESNPHLLPKKQHSNPSPQLKTNKVAPKKMCVDDFDYMRNLGKGSFGEVILMKKKIDEKLYAVKAIDKNFLYKVLFHFRGGDIFVIVLF